MDMMQAKILENIGKQILLRTSVDQEDAVDRIEVADKVIAEAERYYAAGA